MDKARALADIGVGEDDLPPELRGGLDDDYFRRRSAHVHRYLLDIEDAEPTLFDADQDAHPGPNCVALRPGNKGQ